VNPELALLEAFFLEGLRRVSGEEEPSETKAWALRRLNSMGAGGDEDALLTWPASFDYTDTLLQHYAKLAAIPAEQRHVLDFPWTSWNNYIEPLEGGLLGVVSAPDGAGKTTYAECLAEHWAQKHHAVVYVHYELNKGWMMKRRLARQAHITVHDMHSGHLSPAQQAEVADVRKRLLSWQGEISYLHAPGWTMERTIEELRKLHSEGKCAVVVVDYLEKVAASARQIKMRLEWFQREADNVEQLKNFAESAGVPVLMVAQMRKDAKRQDMDKLDRGAIRGAGEKSEKANLVVMLNRQRTEDGYANEIDVLIDKNTMGRAGVQFKQYMQPEFFDVRDLV